MPPKIITRIYQWPVSYLVGLLIGAIVSLVVYLTSIEDLTKSLSPIGIWIFLGAGSFMIASVFGDRNMRIALGVTTPSSKLEECVRKISRYLCIAGLAIPWVIFEVQ